MSIHRSYPLEAEYTAPATRRRPGLLLVPPAPLGDADPADIKLPRSQTGQGSIRDVQDSVHRTPMVDHDDLGLANGAG